MITITDACKYDGIVGNNIVFGAPVLEKSEIRFKGNDNILYCEEGVTLNNSIISFEENNSVVYIGKNNISICVRVYNNTVFRIGRNTYTNSRLTAICSEEKHIFLGDNNLISFGVFLRNADPHLIYNSQTCERINFSKSIFVGDHVWLGQSVLLLKGTMIGSGSIIGANSVVSGKKISSNTSWAGNPARQVSREIFWEDSCVHKWTAVDTEKSKIFNGVPHTYDQDENSLSFNDLDHSLSAAATSGDKLEILQRIGKNEFANRFACSFHDTIK